MKHRRYPVCGAAAALCTALAVAAQAQEPPAGGGVAPPPPRFEPPRFTPVEEPAPAESPPGEPSNNEREPSTPEGEPSRLLVTAALGARYRRIYSGDIAAFQLEVGLGARIRPFFFLSGFVQGAIGATNHGLQTRFLSAGCQLDFPLAPYTETILRRATLSFRPRFNYADIARITTSELILGLGVGADAQIAVDLFKQGAHALYLLGRGGVEGYLGEGEGFSFFSGFSMWGGELMLGFRY